MRVKIWTWRLDVVLRFGFSNVYKQPPSPHPQIRVMVLLPWCPCRRWWTKRPFYLEIDFLTLERGNLHMPHPMGASSMILCKRLLPLSMVKEGLVLHPMENKVCEEWMPTYMHKAGGHIRLSMNFVSVNVFVPQTTPFDRLRCEV
jgi:hypothetical protein